MTAMARCIFCTTEINGKLKPEHVLHDAMGGRMKTDRTICPCCNNTFGGGIDKALAEQLVVIRNALQLKSGSGDPAPMLRGIKAGEDTLNIKGDGRMQLVQKPFTVTPKPDGTFHLQMSVEALDDLERHVPHIARIVKMDEERIRDFIVNSEAYIIQRRAADIPFSLGFGGPEVMRSAAKSCLVLWATRVGNEHVLTSPYNAVRRFVMTGDKAFYDTSARLDTRQLSQASSIAETYGPVFNLIYVRSDANGRVIGHFTVYNTIAFKIVLADAGGIPNHSVALVSNPLDNRDWSRDAAEFIDIEFDWLDGEDVSDQKAATEARIEQLGKVFYEIGVSAYFDQVLREEFERRNLVKGQDIPPDVIDDVVTETVTRFVQHNAGIPYQRAVSKDDLRKALNRKPSAKPE